MPPRTNCQLHIPFKDLQADDPRFVEKMNENNKAIERWATFFHGNCLPAGGGGITDFVYAWSNDISGSIDADPAVGYALETEWAAGGAAVQWDGSYTWDVGVDGLYLCTAQLEFASNGSGGRRTIMLKPTSGTLPYNGYPLADDNDASTTLATDLQFSLPVVLDAATSLEFKIYSASNVSVVGAYAGVALLVDLS